MSVGDVTNIATALVAIAAFLLSVYNFYVDRRDKRTRLVLRVAQETRESHQGPYRVVRIEAVNLSERSVKVSAARVLWKKEAFSFPNVVGWSESFQLEPYDGTRALVVSEQIVASALREKGALGKTKIRAGCQDKLGKTYLSKRYTINVSEYPLKGESDNAN